MTTATAQVVELVARDVEDMLDELDRHGMDYARRYALHIIEDGPRPHPAPGFGLTPDLARVLRERVLDATVLLRMGRL